MQENSQNYQIKIVQNIAEFEKLEPEWNMIAENNGHHVPFLCFDWFKIWLKYFVKGNDLFILLVYDGDHPVAIAPLLIKSEKFRGFIKARKIELIGNVHSPIRNFIFKNQDDEEKGRSLKDIIDFFKREYRDWDVMELESLPEEDRSIDILTKIVSKSGLKQRQYNCFGDWYLDGIECSGDDYINHLRKDLRLELRRRKKRLEELGQVEFKVGNDENKVDHYMEVYWGVRDKSWKNPEIDLDFQKEFRKLAAKRGWLRFGFLLLNGSAIAAQLRIISNSTAYFMDTAHNPEFNRYSPGSILRAEFSKYMIDVDKVKEIDNLRGDEDYKKDWTPKRRERKGIMIFNETPRGQLLSFLMIRVLPIIEKYPNLTSLKEKITKYIKK